jgi:hypothetical protein
MREHALCCFPIVLRGEGTHSSRVLRGADSSSNTATAQQHEDSTHQVPVCLKLCPDGSSLWIGGVGSSREEGYCEVCSSGVRRRGLGGLRALTLTYHCALLPDQSRQVFRACL